MVQTEDRKSDGGTRTRHSGNFRDWLLRHELKNRASGLLVVVGSIFVGMERSISYFGGLYTGPLSEAASWDAASKRAIEYVVKEGQSSPRYAEDRLLDIASPE